VPAIFSVAPVRRNVDPVPVAPVAVPFQMSLLRVNVPLVPRSTFDVSVPLVDGNPVVDVKTLTVVSVAEVATPAADQLPVVCH